MFRCPQKVDFNSRRHFLYLIEHPSGLWYVGLTGQSISRRWWNHRRDAKAGRGSRLHQVIRELGEKTFSIRELSRHSSRRKASEAEKDAIAILRDVRPGGCLNRTGGGAGDVNRGPDVYEVAAMRKFTPAGVFERISRLSPKAAQFFAAEHIRRAQAA